MIAHRTAAARSLRVSAMVLGCAALEPGGPLAGWRLSHGLVVLAGGGVVAVDRIDVPTIGFDDPRPREGGVRLPEGSFFRLVDGRQVPP